MASWLGSFFTSAGGATAPREENLLKKTAPTSTKANSNNTVVTINPVDPTATQLKATPHPFTKTGTQGGGRRTVGRKAKARKAKSKSRSKSKSKRRN